MVQIVEMENQKGKLAEMMGMSLSKGIGNGLDTYFANRSLQSVLQDKSLENAAPSKRMQALQTALNPYGEKGQQVLQQRMQIEQQEMQEKENDVLRRIMSGEKVTPNDLAHLSPEKQAAVTQIRKQAMQGKAAGKYLSGGELTPEEQELFTPKDFVELHKARYPKPKEGALSGQPIPPEINQKITEVLRNSEGLSSDDLKNIMDSMGIPPAYSNGYIENRRRTEATGGEHDIKFHQESAEFEKSVRKNADVARKQMDLIDNSIESVKAGKIKPGSLANILSSFGDTGKKLSNAFLSGKQAELLAAVPEFLEGRKELFGVRLSDADLALLEDKLPSIGKSKEANLAILNLMKRNAQKALRLEKISEDVLEKTGLPYRSGKLRPLGYERDVMKAFDEIERPGGWFEEKPPAGDNKGRVLKDKQGNRYKSNGVSWEPI